MRHRLMLGLAAGLLCLTFGSAASADELPLTAQPPVVHSPAPAAEVTGGCSACGSLTGSCPCQGEAEPEKCGKVKCLMKGPNCGESCAPAWGCADCQSTKCFMFGSCKQFFGKRPPYTPPPGIRGPTTTPCQYGTWHRW